MDEIGDAVLGVVQNDSGSRPNLNISDVLEAISIADPTFGAVDEMYRPAAAPASAPVLDRPYVRIVEQPASKALRFRYECEGRSAGSIPGVNSTPERKTFPAIEVCGYKGRFVVVVSCVTKDKPYKPHPHNLVGREPMCSRGVCTVELNGDTSVVQFSNLGIQCVKRKDIAEALRVRENMKVDPFKTGFSHKTQPQTIDLNAVRLCFQVYIPGNNTQKIKQALPPVVSEVIYDKKAMCELQINRISSCAGPVRGGAELILLCEKVTREDIEVVFSQKLDDGSMWESCANILLVHKQVAIAFHSPPYRDQSHDNVKVQIYLRRISDKACSAPVDYEYIPDYADSDYLRNKKRKMAHIESYLQTAFKQDRYAESPIKAEPRDGSSPATMGSPHYPQYAESADPRYQQWMPDQSSLSVPGPSAFGQDRGGYWGPHNYGHTSPMQSPSLAPSPLQAMSPMQAMSPGHRLSPGVMQPLGTLPPMMGGNLAPSVSPMQMHQPSPMHQASPMHQTSPMHQASPMHQPSQMMHEPQMMPMQIQPPLDTGDCLSGLNSADLSGLMAMLGPEQQPPELSDSMRQLSTSDLVQ